MLMDRRIVVLETTVNIFQSIIVIKLNASLNVTFIKRSYSHFA